ncbi:IS1595 family transposase [Allosphingosinicella vermicomposti]|uniref:IS1595 family transposase n=1 Tax=Allosphingosinicella vermicomposti TaxID=614671 RepID=UPI0018F86D5E|nr:IS1595 family transposase [Allosphingosinicella vermicomposti]
MAVIQQFDTLFQMMQAFPDEQSAIDHFTAIRWKNGPFCPQCGSTKVYHFSDKRTHKCGDCRKRFSIKVGTIFEDSKIELRKWLLAIWLITSHKKGIASTQLAKDIGVTQKTAWFMTHRLRHAIATKSFNRPLSGEIESDETFIGGKEKNKHAWQRTGGKQGGSGKVAVLGMLERGGELRTEITPNLRAATVQDRIRDNVEPGSAIMTDEHGAFLGLQGDYNHHRVNHSAGEYVRHFCLHTNGIESVWALFKRQIVGTHHFLSPKHLSRYLGEMTWRFNLREMGEGSRVNALLAQTTGRLTYQDLIA